MKVLILNGPNLNMLGKREPDIYGAKSFEDYFSELQFRLKEVELCQMQSNVEGDLVTAIQKAPADYDGLVLNAAAYTHTSLAIADAVRAISIPVVEVHISNVYKRERIRHNSFLSPYVQGVIAGFGLKGYELAVRSFIENEN